MSSFPSPRVRMRAYFSTYHLWASQEFANRSLSIEAAHSGRARFDMEHRALVMALVTESGAFLESLVNELFQDCAEHHNPYVAGLSTQAIDALRTQWTDWHSKGRTTLPTLKKFDAAVFCCGLPPMNHGIAPVQNASEVLRLRNALMHSTPEWVAADESHAFDNLKSKFPINALMQGAGNAYFPDKCLGAGCAIWSMTSARSFADHFHALLGTKPHYQISTLAPPSK